jgi:hypothetical protein
VQRGGGVKRVIKRERIGEKKKEKSAGRGTINPFN